MFWGRVCFNPRARVGRDGAGHHEGGQPAGFNPRARVGRDKTHPPGDEPMTVSIHAPAWGATDAAQGAAPALWGFNPRARVGRDPYRPGLPHLQMGFNPRARVGRDLLILAVSRRWRLFQSTRPRGARPMRSTARAAMKPFQSTRPRGARREKGHGCRSGCDVSIHAPAWGATTSFCLRNWPSHVSIHAPAWGATCMPSDSAEEESVSIHAPAWGATSLNVSIRRAFRCFNPRARVGRDTARP